MQVLGIDVGGSGIKGAVVDVKKGKLVTERIRISTPKPATPKAVAKTVKKLVEHFDWKGQVGCAFPTVIDRKGVSRTRGNIHEDWIDCDVKKLFSRKCKLPFTILNDGDAAGMAEMTFGAGKGKKGVVIMITIGTGLGTGVFNDGVLVPNFEFGRIFHTDGRPIEFYAADSARKRDDLSIGEWSQRFDFFLHHLKRICSPDLYIIGGGISKKYETFKPQLTIDIPIVVAKMRNQAGIIGAALAASRAG